MTKLYRCPNCASYQSAKNKLCKCGCDLQRAKKRSVPKVIPLNNEVLRVLNNIIRCAHHDYIFTTPENVPIVTNKWHIPKQMKTACASAEIPYGEKHIMEQPSMIYEELLKQTCLKQA